MALTVVTLEKQDRIGTLTLNRPEKLNALNRSVIGEFAEAIDVVAADPDLKVLIIRGAGRAFSTGYDLSGGGQSTPRTIDEDRAMLQRNVEHWLRLRVRSCPDGPRHGRLWALPFDRPVRDCHYPAATAR